MPRRRSKSENPTEEVDKIVSHMKVVNQNRTFSKVPRQHLNTFPTRADSGDWEEEDELEETKQEEEQKQQPELFWGEMENEEETSGLEIQSNNIKQVVGFERNSDEDIENDFDFSECSSNNSNPFQPNQKEELPAGKERQLESICSEDLSTANKCLSLSKEKIFQNSESRHFKLFNNFHSNKAKNLKVYKNMGKNGGHNRGCNNNNNNQQKLSKTLGKAKYTSTIDNQSTRAFQDLYSSYRKPGLHTKRKNLSAAECTRRSLIDDLKEISLERILSDARRLRELEDIYLDRSKNNS